MQGVVLCEGDQLLYCKPDCGRIHWAGTDPVPVEAKKRPGGWQPALIEAIRDERSRTPVARGSVAQAKGSAYVDVRLQNPLPEPGRDDGWETRALPGAPRPKGKDKGKPKGKGKGRDTGPKGKGDSSKGKYGGKGDANHPKGYGRGKQSKW